MLLLAQFGAQLSPICLYKGNLCRENDIIEVNDGKMASVSLFDFCYVKGERQFLLIHIMQAFGVMEVQFHSFLT